jgi:hypothetical protein
MVCQKSFGQVTPEKRAEKREQRTGREQRAESRQQRTESRE